jgi:hypothetical protein
LKRKLRKACPPVVAIFAKPPVPGKVKTRLLPVLSPEQAAHVHMACLRDVVRLVAGVAGVERCLCVAGPARQARALARQLGLSSAWRVHSQRGRDLGARMANAFAHFFARGAAKAVIIGTDTPWMGSGAISSALRALQQHEVVLGPTEDGGYYLVAARRLLPPMFRGMAWGTAQVFRRTVRVLRQARIQPALLRTDFDLDRPADLSRALRRMPALRYALQIPGGRGLLRRRVSLASPKAR